MRILLAVDGSDCSQNAVHEVATRPWKEGTKLKIISVIEEPFQYLLTDPFLVTEAIRVNVMQEEDKHRHNLLNELKTGIHSAKMSKDLDIETEVVWGSPKNEIVKEAEKWEADLVIVGCHGYGAIKRFFLGSVSQAVAKHAPCSVEIVRCPEGASL